MISPIMPTTTSLVFTLCVLLIFSAFFSASEAALIALNKIRLRHMMEQKKRGAQRVYGLVSRMDRLIATILVGNNLVNTGIAAIATYIFTKIFGVGNGLLISTFLTTVVLVIFGELTPKIMATNHPEGMSFFSRHLISFFIFIFGPITNLLTWISNGIIKLFGGNQI